jgi:hypothetical protein
MCENRLLRVLGSVTCGLLLGVSALPDRAAARQYDFTSPIAVIRPANGPTVFVDGVELRGGTVNYRNSARIRISSTSGPGAKIYYTLDGSKPDFTAVPYPGPFTLTNSATIQAISYNVAHTDGAEAAPIHIQIWPTYPLSATTPGGGSVSVSPGAYSYCNRYVSNTVVTLTATPSKGWSFVRWEGDNTASTSVATVVMDRPRTVQAVFGTSLNLFTNGSGQVLLDPPAGPYPFGSTVQLTALPSPGYYFFGWADGASGPENPLLLTVTNAGITALFNLLDTNCASFSLTRAKAEAGDAEAQFELGCMYDDGASVPRSPKQAFKWWLKAAQQGLAVAQNNVGAAYLSGIGVSGDYTSAAHWYELAAAQGNSTAQGQLGWLYYLGRGVQKDETIALNWWTRSEAKSAQARLGLLAASPGEPLTDGQSPISGHIVGVIFDGPVAKQILYVGKDGVYLSQLTVSQASIAIQARLGWSKEKADAYYAECIARAKAEAEARLNALREELARLKELRRERQIDDLNGNLANLNSTMQEHNLTMRDVNYNLGNVNMSLGDIDWHISQLERKLR